VQEVSLTQLARALTLRRVANATGAVSGFLLSAFTKKSHVWGVPPVLTVEPTNICNLRCPLCVTGNGSMQRQKGRMDLPTYQRLIDELGNKIIYVILFQQGEPYINHHFLDFVSYAKARKLYVTTSTNAHYFDLETCQQTVESGIDAMIVSVDGATQESYAKYRVGGNLEKVLEGIRNLVAAKKAARRKTPYLYLQFLIMRHNEHEIPAMEKLARDLGVNRLLKKNVQVETLDEAREWLPQEERFRRYKLTEEDFVVKSGNGTCPRPWLSTMVNWDGTVVPCCFDKNGLHTTGDMRQTHSFIKIWNTAQYQNFRQEMLNNRDGIDICKNCNQGLRVFV
jgi:radical SAM protein with 4Fe4S-binding SPASM domain